MHLENIFTNFLVTDKLKLDTKPLIDYAYKVCDPVHSQSTYLIDKDVEPIKSLISLMNDKFNYLHKNLGFSTGTHQETSEIWVNINNNTNIDAPHSHPNRILTAVVYLKTPENCGDLVFMNPNPVVAQNIEPTVVENFNPYNSINWKVTPQENMILIFPAWLYHYVKTNLSGQDRISLAMNSVIVDLR